MSRVNRAGLILFAVLVAACGVPAHAQQESFIPDPSDLDKVERGTSASGVAADDMGNIYAADVGAHNLRKYVRLK